MELCDFFANHIINIVDVSQSVLQGYLAITFIVDQENATLNPDRLALEIKRICRKLKITATIFPYIEGYRPSKKKLYIFTFMGDDQEGILSGISRCLFTHNANIETIKLRSRERWVFTQLLLDLSQVDDVKILRNALRLICEELDLSMTLQKERIYRINKKLIVFDMDSTLVLGETIVDIARNMGIEERMHEATEYAMHNDIDFSQSLRDRARLIAGIEEKVLQQIADQLRITPGAEKLVYRLQEMGYVIALISSGFSYFTDVVKKKLDLNYSFGNTLEIKRGKTTGEVVGSIIDGDEKWQIIADLCEELGISTDEVVTIGDGSNDRVMLRNSGLGIGLNSKDVASEVADGKITNHDVEMLLLLLGLSESDIDSLLT